MKTRLHPSDTSAGVPATRHRPGAQRRGTLPGSLRARHAQPPTARAARTRPAGGRRQARYCALFILAVLLGGATRPAWAIEAVLQSCSTQNFPFVSVTINVRQGELNITDLTRDDFRCTENGTSQTDQFTLIPPQPGGSRVADIVFLVDGSGSMSTALLDIKPNLKEFAAALALSDIDFRLGLVRFGRSNDAPARLFNDGKLTDDTTAFQSFVDDLSFPVGNKNEFPFGALRLAAETFDFRPLSQKIFVLLTNEAGQDPGEKQATLDLLVTKQIAVHVGSDCAPPANQADYCDETTSVQAMTGGQAVDIGGPFDGIFGTIERQPVDDYIVLYKSSNPTFDATDRFVQCLLPDPPEVSVECTYVPGAAPHIELTPDTARQNLRPVVVGSSPVIRAIVTDRVAPFVSAVDLFFRTSGSREPFDSVPMVPDGDNEYVGQLRSVGFPGVDYYIQATDGEITSFLPSLQPAALPFQLAVGPNVVPAILHDPVTRAPSGRDLPVRADVTDDTNFLANVKVFWRHVGELHYTVIDMLRIGGDVYEGAIPGNSVTSDLEYYIRAIDDLGVGATVATADDPLHIAVTCFNDTECDDGNACNGIESCDEVSGLCVPGAAPVAAIVAMGDGLSAGFQSSVLVGSLQQESSPALLAAQACLPFTLPLISENGHTMDGEQRPFNLSAATQDATDKSLAKLGGRVNPGSQPFNLAVPGARLKDIARTRKSRRNPLFQLVLQGPSFNKRPDDTTKKERRSFRKGTQLSQAARLAPSLILLAAGTDEILAPTLRGKIKKLPKEKRFKKDLQKLIRGLQSKTTADILITNIPDITTFPHMLPVGRSVGGLSFKALATCPCPVERAPCDITDHLERSVVPRGVRGAKGFYPDGSLVPYSRLAARLESDALCAAPFSGTEDVFRRREVLEPKEIVRIRRRIEALNRIIADVAAAQGLALVDLHRVVEQVADKSFTGGFFSLDGIYPSSQGQRELANALIVTINAEIAGRGSFGGFRNPLPLVDGGIISANP